MCCIFQAWTRVLAEYSCRLVTHTLMATFLEKLLKNWNSNRTWCFPDYPPSVPKLARWAVLPCSQLLMTGFLFSLFPTSKRRLRLVEMVRQCVSPPSVSPPETWSPLPVTFEHTGYPVVFLYWCNHWCLNVTKQRVKAELANNTRTVVFQLRFVWSMRSPPSTVWQILLIIYTVVGTAAHDFVIVWWDCIVFGVVCSLGGFLLFLSYNAHNCV